MIIVTSCSTVHSNLWAILTNEQSRIRQCRHFFFFLLRLAGVFQGITGCGPLTCNDSMIPLQPITEYWPKDCPLTPVFPNIDRHGGEIQLTTLLPVLKHSKATRNPKKTTQLSKILNVASNGKREVFETSLIVLLV